MKVDFHRFPREKYLNYVLFYNLRDLFAIKCERLLNSVLAEATCHLHLRHQHMLLAAT